MYNSCRLTQIKIIRLTWRWQIVSHRTKFIFYTWSVSLEMMLIYAALETTWARIGAAWDNMRARIRALCAHATCPAYLLTAAHLSKQFMLSHSFFGQESLEERSLECPQRFILSIRQPLTGRSLINSANDSHHSDHSTDWTFVLSDIIWAIYENELVLYLISCSRRVMRRI